MAKLQIRYFPDDVLRQHAKKISSFDTALRKLANDMLETMYEHNGVGLAAPQVGISKQMMVIDVAPTDEPRRPIVFINPKIVEADGEMVGLEGCLSFPDVFFEVRRASRVVIRYHNLQGKEQKLEAKGDLLCRAIQHEMDHLDGQLFIDKAVSKLVADLELTKHGFDGVSVELPHKDETIVVSAESQKALIG